jgi:predicted TIM-barrel fold metal-dependent hydrolase
MVIDVEHHLETKESWERRGGKRGQFIQQRGPDGMPLLPLYDAIYDVEIHLRDMDLAGIDMALLSGPEAYSLEEAKTYNNLYAGVVKQYPKRFAAMAGTLPLGGKPAFAELERAIQGLGFKGVIISAQVNGLPLDSRELWPFYKKVSELKVPIFVHPSIKVPGFEALKAPYDFFRTIGREFDLVTATFRLCAGGVLEEFPDLKFVIAHFGGGCSSTKERLDRYIIFMGADFWVGKPLISPPHLENFNKYFNQIYFNMAGREIGMQTVKCALTNISPQRLMYGTDYPPNFINDGKGMGSYIKEIRQLDLDQKSIDSILSTNAIELFKLNQS